MAGEKGNKTKGAGKRYLRLGELLISAGMLTEKQLEEGIALQKDAGNGNWGYNGAVRDEESFLRRFGAITQAFKHMPGFRGYCYTQLTDVFQEVNGLLDMDRNPKASLEEIRRINLSR